MKEGFFVALITLLFFPLWAQGQKDWQDRYFAETYESPSGGKLPYRILQPPIEKPEEQHPLLVLLHGEEGRGSDNQAQLKHGGRWFLDQENKEKYRASVLFPQCPKGQKWADYKDNRRKKYQFRKKPTEPMRLLLELIDDILTHDAHINPDRIYLVGLSMGAYGVYDLVIRRPDLAVAALTMAGGTDPRMADHMRHTHFWIIHGAQDDVVPVDRSRKLVYHLEKANIRHKYEEYPQAGHRVWERVFSDDDHLEWLFLQHRYR